MTSKIQEFNKDRKKKSDLVITIDGPSGAGKGTLADFIADSLDIQPYSAGDFFRQIADDKNLSVEELSERADKETDIKVDERTLEKGLNQNCVIESRIASWVLGGFSDLSIYLKADLDERARRVLSDLNESSRETEEEVDSLEDAKEKIKKRDKDDRERYQGYYGIDIEDIQMYDLVLDNTELDVERQNELVKTVLKDKFPEKIED